VAGLPAWSFALVAPQALLQVGIAVTGALLPARRALAQSPARLIGSIGE
jgi:hypothetical protein